MFHRISFFGRQPASSEKSNPVWIGLSVIMVYYLPFCILNFVRHMKLHFSLRHIVHFLYGFRPFFGNFLGKIRVGGSIESIRSAWFNPYNKSHIVYFNARIQTLELWMGDMNVERKTVPSLQWMLSWFICSVNSFSSIVSVRGTESEKRLLKFFILFISLDQKSCGGYKKSLMLFILFFSFVKMRRWHLFCCAVYMKAVMI